MNIERITVRAKAAAKITRNLSTDIRNGVLLQFASNLRQQKEAILSANAIDLAAAEKSGMKASFVDRLRLSEKSI